MSGSADSNNGLIQMEVSKIRIDERRGEQVVVLKEKGGSRLLPIIIGISEVTAIKMKISGIQPPRPLTHDLLKNTISQLDATR
ncbi:MAG: bifunctional nuclease family protein [Planctomycetes bacterium]|nr:bifunctional nuclease family protein [Planctomycetota bacterium]